MKINKNTMKSDEKATFELRGLYEKYGYSRFKTGKFEEYELYVRNKDFIAADSIITFSDTNGKLMALKPDLTQAAGKRRASKRTFLRSISGERSVFYPNAGQKCGKLFEKPPCQTRTYVI